MATVDLNLTDHPTLTRIVTTDSRGKPLVVTGSTTITNTDHLTILREFPLKSGKPLVKVT